MPAKGVLTMDSLGNCGHAVFGNYVAGQGLSDSNYLMVQIDLIQAGTYNITTDTVNGYSFKGTGTLNGIGPFVVKLKGSGTPIVSGTDNITIFFDSSTCLASVTVVAPGTSGGTAAYTVQPGTGSACGQANVSGTYTAGTATGASNMVTLGVNVTTPGTWNIQSVVVDGFSYSGSGTFTNTGTQSIVLTASGTPSSSGVKTFPITAGGSSCNFTVTVSGGTTPPPPPGTYFPLTANSYWTYEIGTDTFKVINSTSKSFGGNSYRGFVTTSTAGNDTSFYRKDNSGNFYNYVDTAGLSSLGFTPSQAFLDVLFLKETLTTGATYNSDHAGSFGGFPATLRFKYTVENAAATVTTGTTTINNVYQIRMNIEVGTFGVFTDSGLPPTTFYYGKDIGLVRLVAAGQTQNIRYWQIL